MATRRSFFRSLIAAAVAVKVAPAQAIVATRIARKAKHRAEAEYTITLTISSGGSIGNYDPQLVDVRHGACPIVFPLPCYYEGKF